MKKFYPEAYFKRSGYTFESMNHANKKKDMVYFNKKQKKSDAEFNRFNEELVYPTTDSRVGGDAKSQIRRYDLDRLSTVSRHSRTPLGDGLSRQSFQKSRVSSAKYLRDANSIQTRLRQ